MRCSFLATALQTFFILVILFATSSKGNPVLPGGLKKGWYAAQNNMISFEDSAFHFVPGSQSTLRVNTGETGLNNFFIDLTNFPPKLFEQIISIKLDGSPVSISAKHIALGSLPQNESAEITLTLSSEASSELIANENELQNNEIYHCFGLGADNTATVYPEISLSPVPLEAVDEVDSNGHIRFENTGSRKITFKNYSTVTMIMDKSEYNLPGGISVSENSTCTLGKYIPSGETCDVELTATAHAYPDENKSFTLGYHDIHAYPFSTTVTISVKKVSASMELASEVVYLPDPPENPCSPPNVERYVVILKNEGPFALSSPVKPLFDLLESTGSLEKNVNNDPDSCGDTLSLEPGKFCHFSLSIYSYDPVHGRPESITLPATAQSNNENDATVLYEVVQKQGKLAVFDDNEHLVSTAHLDTLPDSSITLTLKNIGNRDLSLSPNIYELTWSDSEDPPKPTIDTSKCGEESPIVLPPNGECKITITGNFWPEVPTDDIARTMQFDYETANGQIHSNYSLTLKVSLKIAWKKVSLGTYFACGITLRDSLLCWGWNIFGQLGTGNTNTYTTPHLISALSHVADVSSGYLHVCATTYVAGTNNEEKELYCWGDNSYGQLGVNDYAQRNVPTLVNIPEGAKNTVSGLYNSCSTNIRDILYCWGDNSKGQLGLGDKEKKTAKSATPQKPLTRSSYNGYLSQPTYHMCTTDQKTKLYCWGENNYGQIGNGNKDSIYYQPKKVDLKGDINEVETGADYTCMIGNLEKSSESNLYCWGKNNYGQLGIGNKENFNTFQKVPGITDITQVCTNFEHTCAISSGNLYCWGKGSSGEQGLGYGNSQIQPLLKVNLPNKVVQVSCGISFTCAVTDKNRLYCWGSNNYGELGNGTNASSFVPVEVSVPLK